MPGIQQTLNPLIRFQRARTSSMLAVSAWPRCSDPVALGGGSAMENGGVSLTASARGKAWSLPDQRQRRPHVAGPAAVGKTVLAQAVAHAPGRTPMRLQRY